MKIVAIVQARLDSTRLASKVLMDIHGKTMLERVYERASHGMRSFGANGKVVVATTWRSRDVPIVALCNRNHWPVFEGAVDDVLGRVYSCAAEHKADVVVRITGDCPLLDPDVLEKAVTLFLGGDYHFVTNAPSDVTGYPDGTDVEVFDFATLAQANAFARASYQREHVTPWLHKAPATRTYYMAYSGPRCRPWKWSVDTQGELDFVRSVYAGIGKHDFGMGDVVAWLSSQTAR